MYSSDDDFSMIDMIGMMNQVAFKNEHDAGMRNGVGS